MGCWCHVRVGIVFWVELGIVHQRIDRTLAGRRFAVGAFALRVMHAADSCPALASGSVMDLLARGVRGLFGADSAFLCLG